MRGLLFLFPLLSQVTNAFFLSRRRRAPQPVPVNCELSDWRVDQACSSQCGPTGIEVQIRTIVKLGRRGGTLCDDFPLRREVPCNRVCYNEGVLNLALKICECSQQWSGDCCANDVNECKRYPSPCGQLCVNTPGSHHCACTDSFTLDGDNIHCIDIPECQMVPAPCAHRCRELNGGYECYCNTGYTLHSDGVNCEDINECKTGSECVYQCVNTPGDYECVCQDGYLLNSDKKTCTDIDECSEGKHGCEQECENFLGGYRCSCTQGFTLASNRTSCNDVDECKSSGDVLCEQLCINTLGSYVCMCVPPYTLNPDKRTCTCQSSKSACEAAAEQIKTTLDKDSMYNWIIGILIVVCLALVLLLGVLCVRRGYYQRMWPPKPPPISTIPRHTNAMYNGNLDDDDASGIYEDLECYEELSEAPEYMDMPDAKTYPPEEEETKPKQAENLYIEREELETALAETPFLYELRTPFYRPSSTYVDSDTVLPNRQNGLYEEPSEPSYSARVEERGFDHEDYGGRGSPLNYDNI